MSLLCALPFAASLFAACAEPAPLAVGYVEGEYVLLAPIETAQLLSLDVRRGEILGFVGASGSGKSVLLRAILGLTRRQSGTIHLFGRDIDRAREEERLQIDMRLGVLFQHGALFSAMTVLENIQVPMREYLGMPQRLMDELAMLKIELVGLAPDAARKYPSELSGGMIQRVALCRAFLYPADILLLDEPFKGQDTRLKEELYETFFRSYENDSMRRTVLFVTHDISEALRLSDAIYVLSGRPAGIAGKFERREFDEDTENKIKALI